MVLDNQDIDARPEKGVDRILWWLDGRISAEVERGVKQHGISGAGLEGAEKSVNERLLALADRLNPRGPVDMYDRGQGLQELRSQACGHQHVRGRRLELEERGLVLLGHDGREWPKELASLEAVHMVRHLHTSRGRPEA